MKSTSIWSLPPARLPKSRSNTRNFNSWFVYNSLSKLKMISFTYDIIGSIHASLVAERPEGHSPCVLEPAMILKVNILVFVIVIVPFIS